MLLVSPGLPGLLVATHLINMVSSRDREVDFTALTFITKVYKIKLKLNIRNQLIVFRENTEFLQIIDPFQFFLLFHKIFRESNLRFSKTLFNRVCFNSFIK